MPMKLIALLSKSKRKLLDNSLGLHFWSTTTNIQCRTKINLLSTSVLRNPSREVVFLGSDSFAIPSLLALLKYFGSDSVTVVVSNHKNIIGNFAKKCAVKTVIWEDFKKEDPSTEKSQTEESLERNDRGANKALYYLGVVASFGYLIPENVINRFEKGIFNVHPSLLPKYRGAAPINHSIINGDNITGVSIMKIAAHKFDVGPLYKVKTVPIHPHVRAPELNKILAEIGAENLSEVFAALEKNSQNLIIQEDHKASLAKKLIPSMANANWNSHNAEEIYNLFRGLHGSYNLRTTYEGKEVTLTEIGLLSTGSNSEDVPPLNMSQTEPTVTTDFSNFYSYPVLWSVSSLPENVRPGHVIFKNSVLCVKCKDEKEARNSGWIFVRKVKVGVKWMSAKDFENGFLRKGRKRGVYRFECVPDLTAAEQKLKPTRAFEQGRK